MARIVAITDLDRPELDVYARLTEPQLRSRREPELGVFIAESEKVIRVALDAGCVPLSLLAEEKRLRGGALSLLERCGDVPAYTAPGELLASLTGYPLTRGLLCAMRRPRERSVEEVCASARRLAVLEDLTDAVNLGAVFRSAAALGLDGVLLTPRSGDPLVRRTVRVSMGTVLQLPWARLEGPWPEAGLEKLRSLGFRTAALALTEHALPIDDPRPAAEPRLAILLGTEGDGLAKETVGGCDYTLRIPMARGVDSLNVAAAGAVAFWLLSHGKTKER